jgi:hypothetical protein
MLRRISVIWVMLVFAASAAAADSQNLYKWTDDRGEIHYTQFPPPGKAALKMRVSAPDAGDASGAGTSPQQDADSMEKRKAAQDKAAVEEKQQAEKEAIFKKNCTVAHDNLAKLQETGKRRFRMPDGEVRHLTETERQSAIDKANQQIAEFCKP